MSRVVYRDGIEHTLDLGSKIKSKVTRNGTLVEYWKSGGELVFFATLKDGAYCAHGSTAAGAIRAAEWKDPDKRPEKTKLAKKIKQAGPGRKITVMEFRLLTGACEVGCREFLRQHKLPMTTSMTLDAFKKIGGDWATQLELVIQGA
jgi:hypothetical protein